MNQFHAGKLFAGKKKNHRVRKLGQAQAIGVARYKHLKNLKQTHRYRSHLKVKVKS